MDFIQYLSSSSWLTFVHPWTLDILETNSDIVFYTLYQPVYKVQDSLFEKSTESVDVIITSARDGLYDRSDLLFELDVMGARRSYDYSKKLATRVESNYKSRVYIQE